MISEQIKECQNLRNDLENYTRKFYSEYKDKIPKELFQAMEKDLNDYANLINNSLYIMYEANFNKDNRLLSSLDEISKRTGSLGDFAGKKIDDIIKEYEQAQNSNSQAMQPYTQSHDYSYQSEPSLYKKLADVRDNYGNKDDNFGQSVMQTTLEHELIDINKRLEELQNKQDLSFQEQAELTKLQMNKETYKKYISDYTNNIRSSFRESRLGKTEEKIRNAQTKIENQKSPAKSYLGRKIQKYNLDRLNNRLAKLKEKKGILMDKQEKAVRKRVERNSAFINVTNNIGAYGQTLGTEIRNIYSDLKEHFSSCKENNKLLNRLEQLRSKLIVCETTYSFYSTQQARTL